MRAMAEIRIRRRRRLREKRIRGLMEEMEKALGRRYFTEEDEVDSAESTDFQPLFVNGEILAMIYEGRGFPTVRGLLKHGADRRYVTVDMGAVPHVVNGADIMSPGIVEADPDIRAGDMVWVRDEKHGKPLAIGEALVSGEEMLRGKEGKAVKNIHHIGDSLWQYEAT